MYGTIEILEGLFVTAASFRTLRISRRAREAHLDVIELGTSS